MTQNDDFGVVSTEGKKKLSHSNIPGPLCTMPIFNHSTPWQARITTWIYLPTRGFHTGGPCSLPIMSKLFVVRHAPDPFLSYKSKWTWETNSKSKSMWLFLNPLDRRRTSCLELPEVSPWSSDGFFLLHTLFCLYFHLCLTSLKRGGNCFFVNLG